MNIKYYPELESIEEHSTYFPSISMIIPMHILSVSEFNNYLKIKSKEVEKMLHKNYDKETVHVVMEKLDSLVHQVHVDKSRKGIALYVSPWFQKVYFLDFEPTEKLILDDSFEIRDLIFNHAITNKIILLLLSGNELKYLVYKDRKFEKIHVDVPLRIEAFMNETLHDVAIYYEKSQRKDKARHANAEQGLKSALKQFPLPVIVAGTEKLISEFKSITSHDKDIIDYVSGNYLESSEDELRHLVQDALGRYKTKVEAETITKIKKIDNPKIIAIGLKEVWKEASLKNVQTLIVEQNFRKPAALNPGKSEIFTNAMDKVPYPMQDAVDDIIEKVAESGGKIQFVSDDLLTDFRRIVLIKNHPS
jgi:hypothetical protein